MVLLFVHCQSVEATAWSDLGESHGCAASLEAAAASNVRAFVTTAAVATVDGLAAHCLS